LAACGGICRAEGADSWQHVTRENQPNLPGDEIQFLKQDDGRVWIGTLSGIGYYKDGVYTLLKKADGSPLDLSAWDVLTVGPETSWIGHGNGVVRRHGGNIESFLGGNTVAPILRYAENRLLAIAKNRGTERNVLYQNLGDSWVPVEGLKDRMVVDIQRLSDGATWITLDGNGVLVFAPGAELTAGQSHLQGLNVTALAEDRKGRVWVGLWGRGVMVYDGSVWERHLEKERSAVLAIAEDNRGHVWAATSASGVWEYDGAKWRNHLAEDGSINLLATTEDGRVWVSSQMVGGLRYWNGTEWVVSLDSPLPMRCLLQAADGAIWAGGVLDGLHILPAP
jgi:ligand-binding sensor domain-containing protein